MNALPIQGLTSKPLGLTCLNLTPTVGDPVLTNDKNLAPDRDDNLISSGSGRRVTGVATRGL